MNHMNHMMALGSWRTHLWNFIVHGEICSQGYIYLVLELCTGGELFDRIIEYGHLTEKQAAGATGSTWSTGSWHKKGCCRGMQEVQILLKTIWKPDKTFIHIVEPLNWLARLVFYSRLSPFLILALQAALLMQQLGRI